MTEDIIWEVLDKQFCTFKVKFEKIQMCKNEYNATGICNRFYCPLANGRYATIKEEAGVLYLCIKTIERAHTPAEQWEKIQLPEDLKSALAIINDNLSFWPKKFINIVKERLVRLHQYLIRYRRNYYKAKPRLVTVHKKFERREQKRELKALVAAKLDFAIKQELLERLKQGTYEYINLRNKEYMEILKEEKRRDYLQRKEKARKTGEQFEKKSEYDQDEDEDRREALRIQRREKKARLAAELGKDPEEIEKMEQVEYVEGEDDDEVDDMEDLQFGGEAEEEEEEEEEAEYEYEDEEEGEKQVEDDLRSDIFKKFPTLLQQDDDDEEVAALKKRFISTHKRKELLRKQKDELKRAKETKKKHAFGAHVEIEYENQPAQTTTTSTTTW